MDERVHVLVVHYPYSGWTFTVFHDEQSSGRRQHWTGGAYGQDVQTPCDRACQALSAWADWGILGLERELNDCRWTLDQESGSFSSAWASARPLEQQE